MQIGSDQIPLSCETEIIVFYYKLYLTQVTETGVLDYVRYLVPVR